MESEIGLLLQQITTSNQWSLLDSQLVKIRKRAKEKKAITAEELDSFLKRTPSEELTNYGVFLFKTGSTFIICTNPSYGRARQSEIRANGIINMECNCSDRIERADKFMSSHDYNGGRHHCTVSTHKAPCPAWKPAPTSHLHSWRRGAEKASVR